MPTVDGDVSEWPPALAITPTVVTAFVDEVRAEQTYFLSWDGQDIYLAGDIAATRWEQAPMGQARARDSLAIQLSPVQAQKPHGDAAPVLFIYPHEGGRDQRQPSAVRWSRLDGYQADAAPHGAASQPQAVSPLKPAFLEQRMWGIRGETWRLLEDRGAGTKMSQRSIRQCGKVS